MCTNNRCFLQSLSASPIHVISPTLAQQLSSKTRPISATPQTKIPSPSTDSQTLVKSVENYVPIAAIGVLLALVCTYISMKNKLAVNQSPQIR